MRLEFEKVQEVGQGKNPDLLHFYDNEAQVLSIENKRLYGTATQTPLGTWSQREFEQKVDISVDDDIKYFGINLLGGFGAVGAYKSGDIHKLLIYELEIDLSPYLENASIQYDINSPVSSFDLSVENVKNPDPEKQGNVGVSEHESYLTPGSRINFNFKMGDSDFYDLGRFYIDRSNYRLLDHAASCNGRNLMGKALKDQSFDENTVLSYKHIHEHIKDILILAGVSPYNIVVQASNVKAGYEFDPNMDYLSGIKDILKSEDNWKIEELVDGRLVAGNNSYGAFDIRSTYQFQRGSEVFSRNIVRDDMDSYRRVCVHNRGFEIQIYKDVKAYQGWNLRGNKTLYVTIPEGTSKDDAQNYADTIAKQLEYVGKVETFTGPFRPYLLIGDEAVIIDEKGADSLGLITQIRHRFGKGGFSTEFTVDSGGQIGQGRLTDYISKITQQKSSSRIYDED
ncbi:hypothetical protein PRVXT_001566 [Proteinivorax tanatarense]|uniref:Uncharacterized protein n=1 Tax=Proteinivorax tanatarense TaxID=1260629 RepID=A0AAU7VHJ0_9FIRM